ncbi:hypothetical protein A7985_03985 [Pseudoalteromonas luteoviolacea]|uniref:Uncharacterized protein n=1 Tax=Pseudoalteromonas luteoviolacea TaxID=43657 RepID=A0A1C0TUW6_9GAMM|nr:hypothetical protein [Pseudoalteromonas luteoviolacea]OCQ23118.1 hypothetical protein A7985_03985 [Pseudoalteromonas luteoviolacea]
MYIVRKNSFLAITISCLIGACGGGNSASTSETKTTPSVPTPTPAPSQKTPLESAFPVSTNIFGITIRATSSTKPNKVLHAAKVMAEYLDNNEDGAADNPLIVEQMVNAGATLLMAPTEASFEEAAEGIEQQDVFQPLFGDETIPDDQSTRFDATLEEVLHLITHVGYSKVYPEIFGENTGSAIAQAMDIARGGQFETIPQVYPEGAWYTYDDRTCDYSCMVTEYTYWGLTSILGAQVGRLDEIQNEWTLNTAEKVKSKDAELYSILTNDSYRLANTLPNGDYQGFEITLSGTNKTPAVDSSHEILQSVVSSNPNYKIAYTDESYVYMMSPDGSNITMLADGSPIAGYVSWGPDAKFVYFASAKGEAESAWEAFRVNVESKELTKLTDFGKDVRSLGVSPDGDYLAVSVMSGNSNIGDNNDNLTQFNTDLYIVDMHSAEELWDSGRTLGLSDMDILVSSPANQQFWYEEINWRPTQDNDGKAPILAYTQTWRYDEDDVSYTNVFTIRADGSDKTLLVENKDQPIWDFEGSKLSFLDMSFYDFDAGSVRRWQVTGIDEDIAAPALSPDGGFMIFEVGDGSRKAGMARASEAVNNHGVVIGGVNVYEPRWSPQPIELNTSSKTVIGAINANQCKKAAELDKPACFIVNGRHAEMNGVIGPNIVETVSQLLKDQPQVKTIVLNQVPGSEDDVSNLMAAKMIHDAGLSTELLAHSDIASGGVDFFVAGVSRKIASGAKLGVHAWGYEDANGHLRSANDLPRDHQEHRRYIEFYEYVKQHSPKDFYFYTIDAASFDNIHYMTEDELIQWNIAR